VVYCFSLYSATADYGSSPDFRILDKAVVQGFASLYQVTEETAKAIEQAGTVKGFKGIVWAKRLWLDFDDEDAARRANSRLKEMGYDYVCYTTGNRGLHFGILRHHDPSHLLPLLDKAWVKTNFPEADSSIYTHLHPFRIPGTLHQKTGRAKVLISEQRGRALTLPPLKREEMQIISSGQKQGKSVFDCFYVMANTVPIDPGQRHSTLVKLLNALKNDAGVSMDIAMWWVSEWNKMLSEPKDEHEIEKAVRSIYER
jgi:hypothetical protein